MQSKLYLEGRHSPPRRTTENIPHEAYNTARSVSHLGWPPRRRRSSIQVARRQLRTPDFRPCQISSSRLKKNEVPAGALEIGDELLAAVSAGFVPSLVTDLRLVEDVGPHAPLTFGGRLVVDGVLVSSYATLPMEWRAMGSFPWERLGHVLAAPLRYWYGLGLGAALPLPVPVVLLWKAAMQRALALVGTVLEAR